LKKSSEGGRVNLPHHRRVSGDGWTVSSRRCHTVGGSVWAVVRLRAAEVRVSRLKCDERKVKTHGSWFASLVLNTNLPSSSTLYLRNGKTRRWSGCAGDGEYTVESFQTVMNNSLPPRISSWCSLRTMEGRSAAGECTSGRSSECVRLVVEAIRRRRLIYVDRQADPDQAGCLPTGI
jgi:hypothetical protein